MPAFGRYSEATLDEMRRLVSGRDWSRFHALVAKAGERAEREGLHAYDPADRACLALFLDGGIRAKWMDRRQACELLGQYDRFLGGRRLKDPAKYLSRFLSHQRSLNRPPFVMVKRCDESLFPAGASVIDV